MSAPDVAPASPETMVSARRSSALVAAIAGIVTPVWLFATLAVVGTYRDNFVPGIGEPATRFVRFYVDNFSRIRLTSTMFIIGWVLIVVVVVALVRALAPRGSLPGTLAVAAAGVWLAVTAASQGLFAWPTLGSEFTAAEVPANLDPGVARFLVLSTEGVQGAGGVVLGVSLLMVALVAARSDLWGHWAVAVVAAVMGVVATLNMVLGGGGGAVIGMIPFGIFVAVMLLIARHRLGATAAATGPGSS